MSIVGLVVGVIRIYLGIRRFKKGETDKPRGIIISILLLVISFLMFVLSNRHFKSGEALRLEKLEKKIDAMRKELQPPKTVVLKDSAKITLSTQAPTDLSKINLDLNEMKRSIDRSEKAIVTKIENKGTNKFWILLNTVLLIIILILLREKIVELLS